MRPFPISSSLKRGMSAGLGGALGLGVASWLVLKAGPGAIGAMFAAISWKVLIAVTLLQLASIYLCAVAWWAIGMNGRLSEYAAARWIRDGFSSVLGFIPGIGIVLGIRALTRITGVPAAAASASTIVDAVIEGFSLAAYTAIGIVCLLQVAAAQFALQWVLLGLATAAPMLLLFILTRHPATLRLGERLLHRAGKGAHSPDRGRPAMTDAINGHYARRGRLATGLTMHLAAWATGAVQVWVASQLLPHSLSFGGSLSLEALAFAGRSVFFWLPLGIGIQEGGFVVIGAMLGLPMTQAVALSLVLRARDIILGVPAVCGWLFREAIRPQG